MPPRLRKGLKAPRPLTQALADTRGPAGVGQGGDCARGVAAKSYAVNHRLRVHSGNVATAQTARLSKARPDASNPKP